MMTVRELVDKAEILNYLPVLNDLYPNLTMEEYSMELDTMLPHNYGQVGVFENEICIAISGFRIGNKLWCGKYLVLDNIVVAKEHRSKGAGQLIFDFLAKKAEEHNCTMLALDSYTTNYKAHKFFYNEGFAPRGFHFIKIMQPEKVR